MNANPLSPAEQAALTPAMRRAAAGFEAQAFAALLRPAFEATDPSKGSFGGGAGERQFRGFLLDEYAKRAVAAGQGLGLADALLREMLRRQAQPTTPPETSP
jgi:Rod binding domain-containing protein